MQEQILESIEDYLKSDITEYAILLNGNWGSGKTYFIRKNILREYKNSIYISLYGITSIEDISEQIYYAILKNNKNRNMIIYKIKSLYDDYKYIRIISFPFVLAYRFVKYICSKFKKLVWIITKNIVKLKFGVDLSSFKKKDMVGIINLFDKMNEYILIIDDLERCSLKVEDVFGYLNNLVEHKKVKCIVIANEQEIEKSISTNYELKLLTSLNDNINFKDENNNDIKNVMGLSSENMKLDISKINKRIDYLYGHSNHYKVIKEKLIGKTLNFTPNIKEIFYAILDFYRDKKDFYKFIMLQENNVLKDLSINNCNNIRTLKMIIESFYNIYSKSIKYLEENFNDRKDFILEKILKNVIFSTIGLKNGLDISDLLSGCMCTEVSLSKDINVSMDKYFTAFDFVNEYIEKSIFNKEKMVKALDYYLEQQYDSLPNDDPYWVIDSYWEQESKELSLALDQLCSNIKSKKYDYKLFPRIIARLSSLEVIEFELKKINAIIESIEDYIKNSSIKYIDFHSFINDENTINIYNKHVDKLRGILNKNVDINTSEELEEILNFNNWGIKLYEYVLENAGIYLNRKSFLSSLDIDKIINNIEKSDNVNIFNFKYTLDRIYDFSNLKDYYSSDLPYLIRISESLNNIINQVKKDKIRKHAIQILINVTDDIIRKLTS